MKQNMKIKQKVCYEKVEKSLAIVPKVKTYFEKLLCDF